MSELKVNVSPSAIPSPGHPSKAAREGPPLLKPVAVAVYDARGALKGFFRPRTAPALKAGRDR